MLDRTHAHTRLFTFCIAATALLAALLSAACKNESVTSNNGVQNAPANTSASPGGGASPAVETTPAIAPAASPGGAAGPAAASQGGGNDEGRKIMTNFPITVTKAKPPITPEPDPFPPRPTPTVVMKNGKIVQQWEAPADAANLTNPMKSKPDAANLGREFYMQKCADCHGKNGQGNGYLSRNLKRDGKPLPPTNLASQMAQANTDGELFWKITNGRSPMPAHRARFDDEQRWYIVTFLRTLKK